MIQMCGSMYFNINVRRKLISWQLQSLEKDNSFCVLFYKQIMQYLSLSGCHAYLLHKYCVSAALLFTFDKESSDIADSRDTFPAQRQVASSTLSPTTGGSHRAAHSPTLTSSLANIAESWSLARFFCFAYALHALNVHAQQFALLAVPASQLPCLCAACLCILMRLFCKVCKT